MNNNITNYNIYKRNLTKPFIYSRLWDYWILVNMGNFDEFRRDPNEFFRHVTDDFSNEKSLYDSLVAESINIYGVEMVFYSLTYDINFNKIWGEDNDRRYERCFAFMAYFDLPKEDNKFTQFSIEPYEITNMTVSKKHFEQASKYDAYGHLQPQLSSYKPKIGDIIKSVYNNYFFEITNIEHEENMFLQSKHTWIFIVKPFQQEHNSVEESQYNFQQPESFNNGDFSNLQNGWF